MTLSRCESSQLKRGEGYSETQKITVKLRWNHGKTHNPLCLVAHCWISAEFPSAFANGLCWFSSAGKFQKTLPNVLDGSVQEQLSKTWTAFELVKKNIKKRLTFWKLLELSYPIACIFFVPLVYSNWILSQMRPLQIQTDQNTSLKPNFLKQTQQTQQAQPFRASFCIVLKETHTPTDFFRALQLKRRQASEGLKELT